MRTVQRQFLCRYQGAVEDMSLDFTVEDETFGGRVSHDLVDDGSDLAVTSANKMHYILLVADWHLNGRLGASAGSFALGMGQVAFHNFQSQQLQSDFDACATVIRKYS